MDNGKRRREEFKEGMPGVTAERLRTRLDLLIEQAGNVEPYLRQAERDLVRLINEIFATPIPRFAPVFGEGEVTILGPYDSVRYPIYFEWVGYEDADAFEVTIRDTPWVRRTRERIVVLEVDELHLESARRYQWQLSVLRGDQVVDRQHGDFSLITREQADALTLLERLLHNKGDSEENRILLWGVLLEQRELFNDAIRAYKSLYKKHPIPGIAYRVARCYDALGLEEAREQWNRKIPLQEG